MRKTKREKAKEKNKKEEKYYIELQTTHIPSCKLVFIFLTSN